MATIDMAEKRGGAAVHLSLGQLGPHLTQCGLDQGLLPYQVASSSIQPFGHNRHGSKIGWGLCPFFWGSWVPIKHKVAWVEAYRHTKRHLSPSSHLTTTDIGRKLGAVPPYWGGELVPNPAQCGLDRSAPAWQVPSWSIQPFDHNRHKPKIGEGGGCAPFLGRGA